MIIDYKKNQKVKVTKPGHFEGEIGVIKSIKIYVDFGNSGIPAWSFSPEELELFNLESIKVDHKITEPEKGNSVDNLTGATKPEKRPYNKRESKPNDKAKRKYTKRSK